MIKFFNVKVQIFLHQISKYTFKLFSNFLHHSLLMKATFLEGRGLVLRQGLPSQTDSGDEDDDG